MPINSKHPQYIACLEDWQLMRDGYQGERVVKAAGDKYLPATPGQLLDGYGKSVNGNTLGDKSYAAYKARAVYPDFISDAVEFYIGLLHQKPATFELPPAMEPLLTRASSDGESLQALLRRINVEQLVPGRLGLLLDMPKNPDPAAPLPYVALYAGEAVINWDDSDDQHGINELSLVVLDETGPERTSTLDWTVTEKYRVLSLGQPVAGEGVAAGPAVYAQGVFRTDAAYAADALVAPTFRGKALDQIPFVFINSKDHVSTPDNPPLIGLGRLCITIYRGEADYRQTLFMQGQDTLVTIGGIVAASGEDASEAVQDGVRVGAGARLDLNMGGDAKYIGVSSDGLSEQREALTADKAQASSKAGQLISPTAGKQESGDALSTRLAAQTASLKQIAITGAAGLEKVLRAAALWMGQDPEKVKVTPNLEFVDKAFVPKELVDLMSAKAMGAPLAQESVHALLVARGVTTKTFDEELAALEEEGMAAPAPTGGLQGDPTKPPGSPSKTPGTGGQG